MNILLKGQLSFLNKYFEVIAVSSGGSDLDIVKKREGVRVIPVAMERKISVLRDITSLIALYKVFKNEKPLIVHSITPKAGLLSMAAAFFAGVPIRVHSFTGLIFPTQKGMMQKLLIFMDRVLCFFATDIFPEGNGVKSDLENYKITAKPLKVIANGNINGVDLQHFNRNNLSGDTYINARENLGIDSNDFVFCFVGRLVKDKGLIELVEAFESLTSKNVKLLLIGSEERDLDPLPSETLTRIDNNSNIILTGFQEDVRLFYGLSDALVFPSYREGFPNVVIQAGAMNLPCIVSNINGSNEIIEHGRNGLIVDVKNTIQLANAMIELSTNRDLYEFLKDNARREIERRFNQQFVWDCLKDEYLSLIYKNKNG